LKNPNPQIGLPIYSARKLNAMNRRQLNQRIAPLEVKNWNIKHPIGTPVKLTKDSGAVIETKTRSAAALNSSGHAVIWLENVSGYYLLGRVKLT
jgi:hypothetical protein